MTQKCKTEITNNFKIEYTFCFKILYDLKKIDMVVNIENRNIGKKVEEQ